MRRPRLHRWSECVHCSWLLYLLPWQSPVCRDRERCVRDVYQQQHEGGSVDWSVSDIRPHDLYTCSGCRGEGAIVASRDWASGALNIEECPRCRGTGLDPAQVPPWAVAEGVAS